MCLLAGLRSSLAIARCQFLARWASQQGSLLLPEQGLPKRESTRRQAKQKSLSFCKVTSHHFGYFPSIINDLPDPAHIQRIGIKFQEAGIIGLLQRLPLPTSLNSSCSKNGFILTTGPYYIFVLFSSCITGPSLLVDFQRLKGVFKSLSSCKFENNNN